MNEWYTLYVLLQFYDDDNAKRRDYKSVFFVTRKVLPWWRHQMEAFSALPVTGEFPSQRPVTRCFDVFFDLCLNKRLSKQSWVWWFETLSHPLWRNCNAVNIRPSHALSWLHMYMCSHLMLIRCAGLRCCNLCDPVSNQNRNISVNIC